MEMNSNSLLAPDYIRESNNFIMEYNFIENQIVFPKNNYFQLVNKPEENCLLNTVSTSTQLQTTIIESTGLDSKHGNSLITLEADFGAMPHVNSVQEQEVINSVQSYPSLSLLAPESVMTDPVVPEDMVSFRFARKALPHKKRISRKLKSISADDQEKRLQFTCEICGHCAASQLDFFAHLKEHYEPTSPHIIASLRTSLDDIDDDGKSCSKKSVDATVDQVFNDVHLHFADFPNVSEASPNESNLKLFNPVNISKCIDFGNGDDTSLKNIVSEEIEFSDTEDMLDTCIRNVVDKVSIEDSCDEIDLIASNGLREHWFNNNNYQRIETTPLKSDVAFPSTFAQILDTDDVPNEEAQHTVAKFPTTLNETDEPKLIDFSTICSEKFEPTSNNQSINGHIQQNDTLSTPCQDQTNLSCIDDTVSSIDDIEDNQPSNDASSQKSLKTKEKYFYCEECKREFNSGNALKYHMRTHTGIRPHKCNVCERSFFAHSQKISHMRTHTGEKPYQCEFCQQKFRQWGDLKYHTTSIHTEEKSHQCEFCGKAFSRKYSLVLHLRIHENERNYKCDFCDKAFRASSYLQNHRRIHTGEKPHECKVCGKRFRVYGDLRRHMRIHQRNIDGDEGSTSRIQDLPASNSDTSTFLQ